MAQLFSFREISQAVERLVQLLGKNQRDEFFIVFAGKHKILTYLSLCTTFLLNCFQYEKARLS